MWQMYHSLLRHVNGWGTQEWLILFVVAVGIGFVALRGFGSRAHY